MTPRKVYRLVTSNSPAMEVEPAPRTRRRATWLVACSFAILVGAGVTASFLGQPSTPPKPKQSVTKKKDDRLAPHFSQVSKPSERARVEPLDLHTPYD